MTFNDWFTDAWGYAPFPWQRALAELDDWPTAIAVPTGCGKTAAIDVWLWRWLQGKAKRRCWYIVDRRVLVDAAFDRARKLVERTEADIEVLRLRGGVFEEKPLLSPSRPAVICSTVDQFGSRLLFRGYGVGRSGRVLEAALAGVDSLVLVDEAHLSEPLQETVAATVALGADITLSPMTATPRKAEDKVLCLSEEDVSHPVLSTRMNAQKLTQLVNGDLAQHATKLRKAGAKSISVWCNTVDVAIETTKKLRQVGETVLFTGRLREHDRNQLLAKWGPRLESDSQCESPAIFVVTTQSLEVGVDWDFDALVSECASIDALKQRFGRLDRIGKRGVSQGRIVKPPTKPMVYGDSALATWKWMVANAEENIIDFGIKRQSKWQIPPNCSMPPVSPPFLLPAHLNAWVLTSENIGLDVSPWLHGNNEHRDCRICWRSDLGEDQSEWIERIVAVPPVIMESASVPIHKVKSTVNTPIVIWRGREDAAIGTSQDIRPGDVAVLPSEAGHFELACMLSNETPDIVEEVDPIVRITPAMIGEDIDLESITLRELLDLLPKDLLERLGRNVEVRPYPGGFVIAARQTSTSVQGGKPISLEVHSRQVAELASSIATNLEIPVAPEIRQAAWWHDTGKADPRFQSWLQGGVATDPNLLAKSGQTWIQMIDAKQLSGYPSGRRHELLSAKLFSLSRNLDETIDFDLVVHLIESHHGWARPTYPLRPDQEPVEVHLDWGKESLVVKADEHVADENRFWHLIDRYGYWGLALIASVLQFADRETSRKESNGTARTKS